MRRPILALLIAASSGCSGSGSSSQPPSSKPLAAVPEDSSDFAAGSRPEFASIPESTATARTQHSSEASPELAAQIRRTFGERCRFERACGDLLVGVDCDAAVDGPYYYIRRDSLEILSRCGGHCMSGTCTDCPPKGWTCATY